MPVAAAVNASEFKAKCLSLLDQVANHEVDHIIITKRGRTVGMLTPPPAADVDALFGCMRGSVVLPDDLDLTAPVVDEPLDATQGILHR